MAYAKSNKKGARMTLMLVFQLVLIGAIAAGIFTSWDRRSGKDRRRANRGGRRAADAQAVGIGAPLSG